MSGKVGLSPQGVSAMRKLVPDRLMCPFIFIIPSRFFILSIIISVSISCFFLWAKKACGKRLVLRKRSGHKKKPFSNVRFLWPKELLSLVILICFARSSLHKYIFILMASSGQTALCQFAPWCCLLLSQCHNRRSYPLKGLQVGFHQFQN